MANLISPQNKYPEKARLNRFLRIPLISFAMVKAFFGGNVCQVNDLIKLFDFGEKTKWQMFKIRMKMVYYRYAYEFTCGEFVSLDFEHLSKKEILKYVSTFEYKRVMREVIFSQDNEIIDTFNDKRKTYKKYKKFFKRDVVIVNSAEDVTEFSSFVKKHKRFIVKQALEDNGLGVKIYDLEKDNLSAMEVFGKILKLGGAVVEELINQQDLLREFNSTSVNTIRFVTFYNNGELTKIACGLRIGGPGAVLDNASRGGFYVGVDPDTGVIFTKGQSKYTVEKFDEHPVSHIKFEGTQIPHWDELLQTVDEIVKVYPEKRFIGWDFAYGDKGWVICEANGVPGNHLTQSVAKEGLRELYSKTLFTLSKDCDKYAKAIY